MTYYPLTKTAPRRPGALGDVALSEVYKLQELKTKHAAMKIRWLISGLTDDRLPVLFVIDIGMQLAKLMAKLHSTQIEMIGETSSVGYIDEIAAATKQADTWWQQRFFPVYEQAIEIRNANVATAASKTMKVVVPNAPSGTTLLTCVDQILTAMEAAYHTFWRIDAERPGAFATAIIDFADFSGNAVAAARRMVEAGANAIYQPIKRTAEILKYAFGLSVVGLGAYMVWNYTRSR